ncbi:MAG TPA: hypothetical protein VGI61_04610 [Parafilimonas sp.]
MKNFFLSIFAVTFLSCGSNTSKDNNATTDSANAIEDHPLQDTQVAPFPDGYATPNAKVDTSQNKKDSLDTTRH